MKRIALQVLTCLTVWATVAAGFSVPNAGTVVAASPPFPRLLTRVRLAPPDVDLYDVLLDTPHGVVYVSDGAGQLHVLDGDPLTESTNLPGTGNLTLDPQRNRLYAALDYGDGDVTVIDTATRRVVGTLSPGGQVAIDSRRGRLYVGAAHYGDPPPDTPGVRVYDADTLLQIGEIAQPGLPVYNPLRDELLIVAYTVYLVDPNTWEITQDLLPEITAQQLRWCNGCRAAVNAYVFPARNLLLVRVTELSPGKGPGLFPPDRFYDATTLNEITDPARVPVVEQGCGTRLILGDPINGRVYRGETYSRYETFNNLLVYDLSGNLITWRDGLPLGVTNPRTGQMYVSRDSDVLVLDLASLSPLGTLPAACVHSVDAATGRVYALGNGSLSVFADTGGRPRLTPIGAKDGLAANQIDAIHVSPDYTGDHTLFVATPGRLLRSGDGGRSWARLRGGLPEGDYLSLNLAVSPDFAADGTLFAAGYHNTFWGEEFYRSTDRGVTWQPLWNGLTHLRVYEVVLSANYAGNRTLTAYARYRKLPGYETGESVFRSTDGGQSWSMVAAAPEGTPLAPPEAVLPGPRAGPQPLPIRSTGYFAEGVERSLDGGSTWQPVAIPGQPEQAGVIDVLASPDPAEARTFYVVTKSTLLRTLDLGETWQRCADPVLAGREDYTRGLTAAAVSPLLPGEGHAIFIGTLNGELLTVDPAAAPWVDLAPPAQPEATAVPRACGTSQGEHMTGAYTDPQVAARLGCATAGEIAVWGAFQPFERGQMIWLGDARAITVLDSRGTWARYPDTWDDTQPDSDPALPVPTGLFQPVRGFGKVWREQLGGPNATVGWATNPEAGLEITRQEFEAGSVLFSPGGLLYILYGDGTWEQR